MASFSRVRRWDTLACVRAWVIGLLSIAPFGVIGASCALESFEKVPVPPDPQCQHASAPAPPDIDASVDAGPFEEFTVAMRVLRLKTAADGGPLGLDIDRFCSCQGEQKSCVPPPLQPEKLPCDLPEGRDNQAQALFGSLELILNVQGDGLSTLYSGFAEAGRWSVLLRVSEYNGTENDNRVRVEWFPSGGTMVAPAWDGGDTWPVVPTAYTDAAVPEPRYVDAKAYVTNNVLVFSLPDGELAASNGQTRLAMRLTAGTVMARIDKQPSGIYLRDGVIAGRMKEEDLFYMVDQFRGEKGEPFCTDNLLWPTMKDTFCRGLDIQADFAAPNQPCNAVSIGIGFDSDPAKIGPTEPAAGAAINCDVGLDPLTHIKMFPCP